MKRKATRIAFLVIGTLIFSVSLQAQKPGKQSWDNLNRLQSGQKVQVMQMDMKSLKGTFVGFSEEAISLRVKKKSVAVPREDLLRVSLREKPKRGRNALLMMGVGAGLGALSGAAVGAGFHEAGETGVFMMVFTPLGAGVGAAVGAAAPFASYETIYRVKRTKPGKAR